MRLKRAPALSAAPRPSSSRPKRVLVVGPIPPPLHGVTVMTAALLEGAADPGLEMIHLDTSDHRGITNVGAFDLRNVALALRHVAGFAGTLWRTRPDLVYLPLSQAFPGFARDAAFLVTARLFSIRVVAHAHGAQYQAFYRRTPAAGRGLLRCSMARVHLIVVLAESLRGEFDGWAAPPGGVVGVPNGVRDEWPGGPPRRAPREGGTVLVLGALIPQKGFLDVLDAAPIVLSAAPDTRFVFAGEPVWDATTTAHVDAALRRPGVEDATTFAGPVEPVERRRLLEAADVVVFAPRWDEGQGLVALEAMSAGLPLVATASGGLTETVRDGVEALIVPRRDPQAVAAALTTLLQDPELRETMGRAARARYESQYTLDGWVMRMRAVLECAANGDSPVTSGRNRSRKRQIPRETAPRGNASACPKPTRTVVDWFSAGAHAFDRQYGDSNHFAQRTEVWNTLIRHWCPPGCRVLDAGCGSGVLAATAAQVAGQVIAADPSREMLDICARRVDALGIANCVRIQCPIEELRAADLGQFDLVLCSSVLEYVECLSGCLAVLSGMICPGGTLIASLPNPASALRAAERFSYAAFGRPQYYGLVRNAPTLDEVSTLLTAAGLDVLDTQHFGVPPTLRQVSRLPFLTARIATMSVYVARKR